MIQEYDELSQEDKDLKEKLKEPLHKLVNDSTSHGIPRIIKSKTWCIRLMWIMCFLSSLIYCGYIIKITVTDYLDYDFITSIEKYNEIPAMFPTVTLCNINEFQTNYSLKFVEKHLPQNDFRNEALMRLHYKISRLNESSKQAFSYPFNETLLKCSFNGIECDAYQFEWIFYPFLGNCFSFNSGKDLQGNTQSFKRISRAGQLNGLHLELFIGNPDLIPEFKRNSGFHVMINNHTIIPLINDLITVAPGTETNLNVNRLFTQRLPYPYNDCLSNLTTPDAFNSAVYRAIIASQKAYRQKDCFELCYQQEVINECGCYVNILEKLNGNSTCMTSKQTECSARVWKLFLASNFNNICSSVCPLECDSMTYRMSLSFSDYPNKLYSQKLTSNPILTSKFPNNSISYNQIKRSVVSLNVYYNEMSYTLISQQPKMQLFDLVSNIGGLLGLFLGTSFLTLAEIIEAALEISQILLTNFVNKNKQKRRQSHRDDPKKIEKTKEKFISNF